MKWMIVIAVAAGLGGCMNAAPTQTAVGAAAVGQSVSGADTEALSCAELQTRNQRITQRVRALEAEQRAQTRGNAVTDAVFGVGLGALVGVGAQGGFEGIRAASGAAQGLDTIRQAEQGQQSMSTVSDTIALAQRSSQLQRAMVEKGC